MYRSQGGDGPPGWFTFIIGAAVIFGAYQLWIGFRTYVTSGGLSVAQATQISAEDVTATRVREEILQAELPTLRPTSTQRPPCQDFEVIVTSAIMREAPTTASGIVTSVAAGEVVCVLESVLDPNETLWYLIDTDTLTRRIEAGYMREDLISPVNPTPTPSATALPPPTITRTFTPTITPSPLPSPTSEDSATPAQDDATETPTPSAEPDGTATPRSVSV